MSESDAIQKKLIGELKDARAKLAESNAELAKALARIQALERELQARPCCTSTTVLALLSY